MSKLSNLSNDTPEDNRQIITSEMAELYRTHNPNATFGIRKAVAVFTRIKTWADVETYLLKGAGLSRNTYRCYMTAVRQLYEFTDGLSPFQITPAIIEAFYDHWVSRVDRNSVYNKVMGLKRFMRGCSELAPGWVSPFDVMPTKLTKKLSKTKKGKKTKAALSPKEVTDLVEWLTERADRSVIDCENLAIVLMLVTSGLRAAELCSLRWRDLDRSDSKWTASFIGKGEKEAEQELYPPAVEACRVYFKKHFRRDPRPEDRLFWTVPVIRGEEPKPMDPHSLWYRIKRIGKTAKAEGAIRADRRVVFSPHLFRRSYATCLYRSGMKLKAIMEKTRHSNIEVLAKHYIDDEEPAVPYFEKMFATA